MLNIAHRGGAGLAPENTLSCFKQGLVFADMIEFDIQPTKDLQLVVYHDRDGIERTTNGKGKVPNLTLKHLRSLDAGSWFDQKYKGERIPTLSEVLEETSSTNIHYNIELKYYDPGTNWFENEIINTIKKYKIEERSVITARYKENILRIQEIDPQIDLALLQKERTPNEYFKLISKLDLKTAQIRPSALEPSFLKKCHEKGIRVFYFYADEPNEMKRVINLGINGLLTNYPDRLRRVLNQEI
ncbi:MAG: glycerophosphodiester phosphodiesterase [Candidatus Thorarchaeota archaeon]